MSTFASRERTSSHPARLGRLASAALAVGLTLAALALGGAVASASAATSTTQQTTARTALAPTVLRTGSPAQDLLALTNQARAAAGLAPLTWSAGIAAMAQNWSQSMAGDATVCAVPPLAHNPSYKDQTPGNWTKVGENVGCAEPASTTVIFNAWMGSGGHKENILRPEFTHIGIGWAVTANGIAFATQDFATYPGTQQAAPAAAPAAPAPTPTPAKKIAAAKPTSPPPAPTPAPASTPAPTPTATPAGAIEPVANTVGEPTPAPSTRPSPVDSATPTSSTSAGAAPGLGNVLPQPWSAQGAADQNASPNWLIPAGVSTLTLFVGGAWIYLTRRRRLAA